MIESVAAKEPDLQAQPAKPVLRKPGEPIVPKWKIRTGKQQDSPCSSPTTQSRPLMTSRNGQKAGNSAANGENKENSAPSDVPQNVTASGSDEDEDGPILYRDEEEDEPIPSSGLFSKVFRKDTLALRLDGGENTTAEEIHDQTPEEIREKMELVSVKLERCKSM